MRFLRGTAFFGSIATLMAATVAIAISVAGCAPPVPLYNHRVPDKPIQKWISLSPNVSEIANLLKPTLIGHTAADDWPVYFAKQTDSVVANVKPDYELIAAKHPDLIVYDPSLYNANDLAKLKELNIPLFALGGDTVDQFISNLYILASMTLSETNVQAYITRIKQAGSDSMADPTPPGTTVAIVLAEPNSNPMVAGSKSFFDDLINWAGAKPVGPDSNDFVVQTPEQLIALNPTIVVVGSKSGDFKQFLSDPRFAGLQAVKQRKVLGINEELVERRGGRVDIAIANLHSGIKALTGGG